MTAQTREPIRMLKNSRNGERLFIVGCGPSLDDVDLEKLKGKHVFALNCAITILAKLGNQPKFWWLYYDMRNFHECEDRLNKIPWACWRCIVHKKGLETMRRLRSEGYYVEYSREQFKPERSVVETALLIADYMGYDEAVLVGVDGFAVRDKRAYCKALSWKEPRFCDLSKKNSERNSQNALIEALRKVREMLQRVKVYQTSKLFPVPEMFEFQSYEDAVIEGKQNKKLR